jgi:AcrR family transcriptional regulator
MPPKVKYSKEQIVNAAFELVRREGKGALTARGLASELNTSTAPIFTAFSSIDEVCAAVRGKILALYSSYINEGLSWELPFKGAGRMYIKFAKDEPNFFKMLWSDDEKNNVTHFLPSCDENSPNVQSALEKFWNIGSERAKKIYNHMSVYAFGLAVLCAEKNCVFTDEDIDNMLSELFLALIKE